MRVFTFDLRRFKDIYNDTSNTVVSGTSKDDYITNTGNNVTIRAGKGNDDISNSGDSVTINTDAGDDYVSNDWGYSVIINTGIGNDEINTWRSNSMIISGGKGNDTICNDCYLLKGSIHYDNYDYGSNVLFKYSAGDGNDIIYGFKADSTLSIAGAGYTSTKSGDDIIVTVDDGKISLIGAADYISDSNIVFTQTVEANSWTLDGTTAKYGTANKTLATVSGVKSKDGLSVSGTTITVSNVALN